MRKTLAIWSVLAAMSLGLTALMRAGAVPAAILIGPMLSAIAVGLNTRAIAVPRPIFTLAQGVVGCLIAGSMTPDVLGEIVRDGHALLFGVVFTILASTAVGWLFARFGSLPGSTAAWGSSPGAASAMVAMADEFGADARLVAAMQYVRVICVVVTASFVSRAIIGAPDSALPGHAAPAVAAFDIRGLAATIAIAVVGSWIGRRARVPAGGMLVPLAIGAAVNATGLVHLALPAWLLAAAYAVIGWFIGLQFERESLLRSTRALPEMALAAAAIILLCGLAAWFMVHAMGFAPLTAFLATSPGGIDTVAIIALSGGADTPFVMALQTLRVLAVVVTGPAIARLVARTSQPPA